ncbi:uncharacterized protein LOC131607818 [Vicia villosa]|uniref:uncharacterized protein LOC131607818 n=1 Tax=Vicia villosa TaxID=3911 RepID=UPI00273BA67E|nr:uncharacterized protein LOC131607818 [Vicia villosa]
MASQNNSYVWSHIHEILEPVSYPQHHHHHHHHQSRHVATYEEAIAEANQSYYEKVRRENEAERQDSRFRHRNSSTYESVDQEAEAFIQHEHRRMALAKLMSSMKSN